MYVALCIVDNSLSMAFGAPCPMIVLCSSRMVKNIGTLLVERVGERQELMAPRVWEALEKVGGHEEVGIVEIDPELSDSAVFCEHYNVGREHAVNCVILEAARGEKSGMQPAWCRRMHGRTSTG